jgi:hypothetical protein
MPVPMLHHQPRNTSGPSRSRSSGKTAPFFGTGNRRPDRPCSYSVPSSDSDRFPAGRGTRGRSPTYVYSCSEKKTNECIKDNENCSENCNGNGNRIELHRIESN